MKINHLLILMLFCFLGSNICAQQGGDAETVKSLRERITDNRDLFYTNTDQAFLELDNLLKEAVAEKDQEAELILLYNKSQYYLRNNIDKSLEAALYLKDRAEMYNNVYFQAAAHELLINVYGFNKLTNKAVSEFEETLKLLDKVKGIPEEKIILLRANAYTSLSNAYVSVDKTREAARMNLKANAEVQKFKDSRMRKSALFLNYSNLGSMYVEFDIDSAEYFVMQSRALAESEEERSLAQFANYLTLGKIYRKRKMLPQSIENYKLAENLIQWVTPNLEEKKAVYEGLSAIYMDLDSTHQADVYNNKIKDIEIQIAGNQNKSLHKIIDDDLHKEKNYSVYIIVGSSILVSLMLILLLRFYQKNKLLSRQEKISKQYLEETAQVSGEQDYAELIEMAKNNDPAFLVSFQEKFPAFFDKLLAINDKLVQTEIDFCALLKLNISTHDIAKYRNIEMQSVRNKKYRIRKKLNIPNDAEIYTWFSKM